MRTSNNNQSFLQQIFENFGTFIALLTPIAQYAFRDEFRAILNITNDTALFNAFTLVAVIFGFTIILGLFANKQILHTKIYLDQKAKVKYLESIQPQTTIPAETSKELPASKKEFVDEPFYLDISRIAFISLILSAIAFSLIFVFVDPLLKNICYLVFILSSIFTLTVYVLKIYQFEEWKYLEEKKIENINDRIQKYFSRPFKTYATVENSKDIFNQYRLFFIEVDNVRYKVTSDRNNPNKFFEIIQLIDTEDSQK